jgi:hypothetical protein
VEIKNKKYEGQWVEEGEREDDGGRERGKWGRGRMEKGD